MYDCIKFCLQSYILFTQKKSCQHITMADLLRIEQFRAFFRKFQKSARKCFIRSKYACTVYRPGDLLRIKNFGALFW